MAKAFTKGDRIAVDGQEFVVVSDSVINPEGTGISFDVEPVPQVSKA